MLQQRSGGGVLEMKKKNLIIIIKKQRVECKEDHLRDYDGVGRLGILRVK